MRNAKVWVIGAVVLAVLVGGGLLIGTSNSQAEPVVVVKDHWRHHDGHWDYWHDGDKRWYHTDGANWYYSTGDAWHVYNFDKGFGREGFERGEYRVPGEGVKIVVPRHPIWRPR